MEKKSDRIYVKNVHRIFIVLSICILLGFLLYFIAVRMMANILLTVIGGIISLIGFLVAYALSLRILAEKLFQKRERSRE